MSKQAARQWGTGEMERIYFTGVIEPETNDLQMLQIIEPVNDDPAALHIDVRYVDPTNADPTLAAFYAPRDDDQRERRRQRKDGE